MDGKFVTELAALVKKSTMPVDINGVPYTPCEMKPVVPVMDTMKVHTLTGLYSYAISQGIKTGVIFVEAHNRVWLLGPMDALKRRDAHVLAEAFEVPQRVVDGNYYEAEMFIIMLRSLFAPTDDRERLINFVSRLRSDTSLALDDDGVSQKTSVTKGLSGGLKTGEAAPVIVTLSPNRTFHDIEQPASQFLFRMREAMESRPQCALFEADQGMWKLQAIQSIKEYFRKEWEKDGPEGLEIIA